MNAFDYQAPKTLADVLTLLGQGGERARPLAGGTDLIAQLREGRRRLDLVVDVKNVPEVNDLSFDPARGLRLGAAVPCYRIYEHPGLAEAYPGLIDAVSLVGGVQIQSRASVGGNLCNASPAADTVPPLMALGAVCQIAGPEGTREVPVEQFCVAPGRTTLAPEELLVALTLPPPSAGSGSAYLRFIPRNEMDIAVAGAGVRITLDEKRQRCTAARIALAAVGPTPLLAEQAGTALVDGPLTEALLDAAAEKAREAARPISDMRGDADYRRHLVGVLVKRALRTAVQRAKES